MGMSNAERQRQYRQRHLTDVGGKGARLNLVVDIEAKAMLERLAACYGVTLREAVRLSADQAEETLLANLSADQRATYYRGELSLRRNGDGQADDAGRRGQVEVDQAQQDDAADDDGHQADDDADHQGHAGDHAQVEVDQGQQSDAGTDRDARIIRLFTEGTSKRAIARKLGISDGTVRNVLKRQAEAV